MRVFLGEYFFVVKAWPMLIFEVRASSLRSKTQNDHGGARVRSQPSIVTIPVDNNNSRHDIDTSQVRILESTTFAESL